MKRLGIVHMVEEQPRLYARELVVGLAASLSQMIEYLGSQ
jgi:hypothetical protein